MTLPKLPVCGHELDQLTCEELKLLVDSHVLDSYLEREATKIVDLRIWQKRYQNQLEFVLRVLVKRGYEVKYNGAKITATSADDTFECYITDNHVTSSDLDLCIPVDQFSLWLDS
ncbi:hypothetical protein [Photobacterium carnosum]|uniref:hypothetical protein n=1 Tax=Photobacterium carnosum TaxID=2023717 RepID=UPI001E5DE179|nr:hypothetical protein [Photobacterium carnosum]MCD9498853.1 hypothetical protein [Photobacterium carnosum]